MRDTVGFLFGGSLPACAACEIRSIGVCAKSGADELAWLEDAKIYRTYASGDVIAHAGRRLPFVGSVMVGVASLSRVFEDGRHQSVGLLMPGDFLGRPGRPQTFFDVIAVTDVELCGFQHKAFDLMLEQAPELRARMVEVMLDELDAARAWMVMLGRKTAREKISSLIAILKAPNGCGCCQASYCQARLHQKRQALLRQSLGQRRPTALRILHIPCQAK